MVDLLLVIECNLQTSTKFTNRLVGRKTIGTL